MNPQHDRSWWLLVPCLVSVLLMCGCSNAILFGEKGQFGMVLEADGKNAAAPIVGSIAAKHTLMVIVPGNGELQKTTDAASMFSQFSMSKHPEDDNSWGRLKIHSAFITGDACKGMGKEDLKKAAQAFAGITAIEEFDPNGHVTSLDPYTQMIIDGADRAPFDAAAVVAGYPDYQSALESDTLTDEKVTTIIAELKRRNIEAP
jgi:hypothetical protein